MSMLTNLGLSMYLRVILNFGLFILLPATLLAQTQDGNFYLSTIN